MVLLIVDDAREAAEALELACDGIAGLVVRTVSSARTAVRILDDDTTHVAAVLTDVQMPGMDGFALLEHIRAHPRYHSLPVIVVTAAADEATRLRAARLGAGACFGKPFSPLLVRRTLERLLHANETVG